MFAKITRQRICTLVMLSLLLTSLWPLATSEHGEFPEEDTCIYGVQDTGQVGDPASPSGGENTPARGGMDEDAYSGVRIKGVGIPGDITFRGAPFCGLLGDPVLTSIGEYYFEKPLLDLGGPLPIQFTLYYASRMSKSAGFHNDPFGGDDFTHNYHISLRRFDETRVVVLYTGGNLINFQKGSEWQVVNEEVIYQLKEDDDHYYLMDPILERVYTFEKATVLFGTCQAGILICIEDRNGNALTFTYDSDEGFVCLTRVEDGLGRSLDFTYMNPTPTWNYPHLASVTDHAGRTIQFEYDVFTGEVRVVHLRSVTDALGMETTFSYTGPLRNNVIVSQTLPRGNVLYLQTYEREPIKGVPQEFLPWRVISQRDAYGNATNLSFNDATGVTTITDPLGNTYLHTHQDRRLLTEWTDETGNTVILGYDDHGRRSAITDRLGDTTQMAYHQETGKIASITNAEGDTTNYTYTAQDQSFNPVTFTFYDLTRITYADGSHENFTYDGHGNLLTYTDRLGKAWTYTYNERGQPLTVINPTGGVVTYTYNADATLASRTDSDVGLTTFAYDVYKRPITITRPDSNTVHFTYDLNDRLLTITDELCKTTAFAYDANGNLVTATNPLSETVTYAYDLMDRLACRTDPLGHASTYTYDEMDRLETFTNRNGNTISYTYDARGLLTRLTDPAGKIWTTAYDDERVPTAFLTPLGRTTAFQTDKLDRTTRITDPLGAATHFIYDDLGRLTSATDRVGRTTDYAYDDVGRLTGVTKPVIGTATYTRNDLGLLTRITDLWGKHWDFGYSPMGRVTSHIDPLGNQWNYTYDSHGRLSQIAYPGGSTAIYTYDDAGRVTQVTYPGGPTLEYIYDGRGLLLTANHLTLAYDARGDVTNSQDGTTSFDATYDDGRRLKTVTYDGQATVTYTYDERDLLTRVEDDLCGAWMEFTYDTDGRLTGINRSNGVSTAFTYDYAGRVTRIQDGTLAYQQYTLNAEGEPTEAVMNVPLGGGTITYTYANAGRLTGAGYGGGNCLTYAYDNSGNLLNQTGKTPMDPTAEAKDYSYDNTSQISSPGYAYDARGHQTAAPGKTFAYDGASRLTSVTAGDSTAAFTYNGLGGMRTRTVNSTTTSYYHNYALWTSPIVAEKEGGGYKRFYVYTPGGALLYSVVPVTGQVHFYHSDRLGSTLFLTDEGGDVSDAYAYDPYGNLLGHTGSSDQPFTYVGRYGVRWEPVGGLYHMCARYYDPATARFLTRDPALPVLTDPQSLNLYQYAAQNPLRYIDPQGMRLSFRFQPPWIGTLRFMANACPGAAPLLGIMPLTQESGNRWDLRNGAEALSRSLYTASAVPRAIGTAALVTGTGMQVAGSLVHTTVATTQVIESASGVQVAVNAYVQGSQPLVNTASRLANFARFAKVGGAVVYGAASTIDAGLQIRNLATGGHAKNFQQRYEAPGARTVRLFTDTGVQNAHQVQRDLNKPWYDPTRYSARLGGAVGSFLDWIGVF